MRKVERAVAELLEMTGRRQEDLLAPADCEALGRARARLRSSSALLRSQTDLAVSEVRQSLHSLQSVLQHQGGEKVEEVVKEVVEVVEMEEEKLLVSLDQLDEAVSQLEFDQRAISVWRDSLERILSSLQPGPGGHSEAARLARLALLHLVQVRSAGLGGAALNTALENFLRSTRNIRNIITATEPGQESDQGEEQEEKEDLEEEKSLESPLDLMICAAEAGDEAGVTLYSTMFTEHALKLVEVADLACTMSSNQEGEGVEAVRQAASHLQSLHSQVISAARVLTVRSDSQAAHTNMARFRQDWDQAVMVLTEAVDNVVTIQDFLTVSEKQILEDMRSTCIAVRERDRLTLANTARSVEARTVRITEVIQAEMEKFETGLYTETVLEAVRVMQSSRVPQFVAQVRVEHSHWSRFFYTLL